jgi:hypothetical protein
MTHNYEGKNCESWCDEITFSSAATRCASRDQRGAKTTNTNSQVGSIIPIGKKATGDWRQGWWTRSLYRGTVIWSANAHSLNMFVFKGFFLGGLLVWLFSRYAKWALAARNTLTREMVNNHKLVINENEGGNWPSRILFLVSNKLEYLRPVFTNLK